MADIKVYQLFAAPLSKGGILFGRSDEYTDTANVNPTQLYWDNVNYELGLGTSAPSAKLDVRGTVIFNDDGGDFDVRMEGDTDGNLFFLDASTDRIGIGTVSPTAKFSVEGGAIFNEGGESVDFRIESNTQTHCFFVDGSENKIGINQSTVTHQFDINGDLACTNLYGQNQTVGADDTLYFGSDSADNNIFLDREGAGSQFVFGYNTPKLIGTPDDNRSVVSVYDNSTDRNLMFATRSEGTTGGQTAVIVNQPGADIDFEARGDTDATLFIVDASTDRVGIGVVPTQKLDVNGITLVRNKLAFTQADLNEYIDSLNDGYMDYGATIAHRFNTPVRSSTASYRRYYHLELANFDPGVSGAVWTPADGTTVGGWQVDADASVLESKIDVHADWDGASDPTLEVRFQINAASAENDNVDIQVTTYYMGNSDAVTKTQAVTVGTNVGDGGIKPQFTMFTVEIPLAWDEAGNNIDVGDCIAFAVNLVTASSDVGDIIINAITYHYNTTHTGIESGDT